MPRAGEFPGALSWSRCPLSPVECPRHSLTTAGHLHPEKAALCLQGARTHGAGVPVFGLRGGKPADTTVQSPPPRRSPCKIPVKGSPFTDGRTGGRPPGEGFCPSRGWPVSGPDSEPRMRTQAPPTQASLGATCPTLEEPGQDPRFPGHVTRETEARPAPRGPHIFPWPHFPAVLPLPHQQSAQGGPGDLGPGLGPATVMRQVKRARGGGPHDHGRVLQGGLRPAPRLGP